MISLKKIQRILADKNPRLIEDLAQEASRITRQYFGRTISLYTPLYLSNYCSSHCIYCNFNSHHPIKRMKLSPSEIDQEMKYIAKKGIQNILLLTGESEQATPVSYLKEAVRIARKYFPSIGLEVFPMETDQYRQLYLAGVDAVTIYQETYHREHYRHVHLSGRKRDYTFRKEAPKRIAQSGIRQISMGILLGLHDLSEDLFSLFEHLRLMEKQFPGVEYSLSFPRLRPIENMNFTPFDVTDIDMVKIICLARIQFPRVGINLSTRESQNFRDHALEVGITKISAESRTSVGGYATTHKQNQYPQFDIQDDRSVEEIIRILKKRNIDPVFTDWRRIENECL